MNIQAGDAQSPVFPKAFLLDMDGVLFHGDKVIPHAIEFMQTLQDYPHVFITNNPILLPADVADKLVAMGFPKPRLEQIITSGIATAAWLAQETPDFHYYAVGAQGLHDALADKGIADAVNADYVVVGEGRGLDYDSLTTGLNLIVKKGAGLIVTNPDQNVDGSCAGDHCLLPGGGALVAPFQIASGVDPIVIGKPEPFIFEIALQKLGCEAESCLMIGDRPDTDILGAQLLGIKTALVRTGRFSRSDPLPEHIHPDYDVESLAELKASLPNI